MLRKFSKLTRAKSLFRHFSSKFPEYLLSQPATEVTTINNGMTVASEGSHGQTATVGVYIKAGSKFENDSNSGVAHFLEHMNFKGTEMMSINNFEAYFENAGAQINAYTSREYTVYNVRCLKKDIKESLTIIADMLQNSRITSPQVNSERYTILREKEEVERIPEEVMFDLVHEASYPNSSLGFRILGPEENINTITRKQIIDFVEELYIGPRMVVAGAGAIDHEELVALTESTFGKIKEEGPHNEVIANSKQIFESTMKRELDEHIPVAHTMCMWEAPEWISPDTIPFMLFGQILGEYDSTGMSSNLGITKLSTDLSSSSSCLRYSTFFHQYEGSGLFGFYLLSDPINPEEPFEKCYREFNRLSNGITETELAAAKEHLKTQIVGNIGDSNGCCDDIGRQMLFYGRRISLAELFMRIDEIELDTLHDVAKKYISNKIPAQACLGSISKVPDQEMMQKWSDAL
eukprot:TRINITY_DN1168_c0_g2_i8.p1 TRINITY_DN1168_c0_g2~~TRINITY_DN1168_c0_g2_i8.p1  ORF type:complete len:481 (+),score=120.90 TRINITY_DN1168_c0_g2_i8:55-1443(+)